MGLSDIELYSIVTVSAFVGFLLSFNVSWVLSALIFKRHWVKFPLHEKADWASRCNSTLHAAIVVPGFIITLITTDWSDDYFVESSATAIRCFMCISLGYFAFDFFVIAYYRVPLWVVFLVHHIVASVPYYVHLFHPCHSATWAMAMFLLVEIATFFLNFQVWFEKTGHAKSHRYTIMFYITYVSWFASRVVMPVTVVAIMWKHIYFSPKADDHRMCLIPTMVCGHLILLFCISVFCFVMTPDLLKRWKESPEDVKKREQEVKLKRRRSGGGAAFAEHMHSARSRSASRASSVSGNEPFTGSGSAQNSRATSPAFTGVDANAENQQQSVATNEGSHQPSASQSPKATAQEQEQREASQSPADHGDGTIPSSTEGTRNVTPSTHRQVTIGATEVVSAENSSSSDNEDGGDAASLRSNISFDDLLNVVLSDNPISERPEERPLAEDVELRGLSLQESSALYDTTALR